MKGLSFGSILGIVFIVLKLIGKIDWAWKWVLSPFWIGAIVSIVVVIIYSVIVALQP
jgi:hypothetical protein